jgi:hypothetical protein
MELTLAAYLAAGLFFGLLAAAGKLLTRGPGDVVMIFLLSFSLFYGLRPLLFVLGLDVPFPEELFYTDQSADLMTTALLGLSVFLLFVIVGIAAITMIPNRGWGPFFVPREVDVSRAMRLTVAMTALAALISAYLVVRYGGVGGVIRAAKVEKALAGMFVLKTVPSVGAVIAVATFLDARTRPNVGFVRTYAALGFAIANAFFVFMWGSRSLLVIVVATLILGLRSRRAQATSQRQHTLLRIGIAVLLVIAVAGGLRVVRDNLARGEVVDVYADASAARQASLATNSIFFDATMLSFRDWPSRYAFRNGEDFAKGAVGIVPRMVWADKPSAIPPGKWFRQVYEPGKINGWPMGAGALWYLNFGWLGLLAGGLLSGLAIGTVAAAQRRSPSNGFNTSVGIVVGVYVFGLGLDNETLIRFIIWLVPLWVAAWYVAPRVASRDRPEAVPSDSYADRSP